ncbi:hypothetical protein F4677DRAFT_419535 [Hypoxylon crocopeplum]|nr:hypothetical protein F4677DRAFT_419535 [Hypoxylon crocopeplum]
MAAKEQRPLHGPFSQAANDFVNSLTPKDKAVFLEFKTGESSETMVHDLRERVKKYQAHKKLYHLCQRVERVSSALSPFFDVVNIFIQSNPEYSALVWGAIRLVFLLGSNYTSFLEKVLVMLEKISDCLPAYEDYYQRLLDRKRRRSSSPDSDDRVDEDRQEPRVVKALGLVYTDIVMFCQRACKIFTTRQHGFRYKASTLTGMFWKPFDLQFSALLERMDFHQSLFESEMQLEEWKYLETNLLSIMELSQKNLAKTEELGQKAKELEDLKKSIETHEHVISWKFDEFKSQLDKRANTAAKPEKIFDDRIEKIKAWTDSPDFRREFEKARHERIGTTGTWFTESPAFQAFKNFNMSPSSEPDSQSNSASEPHMLLVQGKPGYGKTVLSSLLIEDLQIVKTRKALNGSSKQFVFFYHFSGERTTKCSSVDAFRAVLLQLIHQTRGREDILDVILVMIDSESSGQVHASGDEIMQTLMLALSKMTSVTLVFDGVDECSDHPSFLKNLHRLCSETHTKALLLSRPNIPLPPSFKNTTQIVLEHWQNIQDITMFLEPEIQTLVDDHLLPSTCDRNEIVRLLACRAQGMFLWAHLMVKYLGCQALSPRERLDAIFTTQVVEGLEGLYSRILRILNQTYSKQRATVHNIFKLLVATTRPLTLPELHQAVAVRPGQVTRPDDLIIDFKKVLPIICGALVEYDNREVVSFVHSSFREFITETMDTSPGPFAVVTRDAHLTTAVTCLSYLIYDIPRGPFGTSGEPGSPAKIQASLDKTYPLLKYSIHWVHHATRGLSNLQRVEGLDINLSYFTNLLEQMLQQRDFVTSWIELSWIFSLEPNLEELAAQSCFENSDIADTQFGGISLGTLSQIKALSRDLASLNQDWRTLLEACPASIWNSTMTAFAESDFWFRTPYSTVYSFAPADVVHSSEHSSSAKSARSRAILVKSQASVTGDMIASVIIYPSSLFALMIRNWDPTSTREITKNDIREASANWYFKYELHSTKTKQQLGAVEDALPCQDVIETVRYSRNAFGLGRFPFPVAITKDLRRLLVLRTLVDIDPGADWTAGSIPKSPRFESQHLAPENQWVPRKIEYPRPGSPEYRPPSASPYATSPNPSLEIPSGFLHSRSRLSSASEIFSMPSMPSRKRNSPSTKHSKLGRWGSSLRKKLSSLTETAFGKKTNASYNTYSPYPQTSDAIAHETTITTKTMSRLMPDSTSSTVHESRLPSGIQTLGVDRERRADSDVPKPLPPPRFIPTLPDREIHNISAPQSPRDVITKDAGTPFYQGNFSDDERVLFFSSDGTHNQEISLWTEDDQAGVRRQTFVFRGTVTGIVTIGLAKGPAFLIHPTLPVLLLCEYNKMSVWWYKNQPVQSRASFAVRGVGALHSWKSTTTFSYYTTNFYRRSTKDGMSIEAPLLEMDIEIQLEEGRAKFCKGSSPGKAAEPQGAQMTPEDQNSPSSCEVVAVNGTNMMVVQSLKPLAERYLGYLPQLRATEQTSLSVLPVLSSEGSVSVVWNKDGQTSYSVLDEPSRWLPSVIERRGLTEEQQGILMGTASQEKGKGKLLQSGSNF